MKSRFRNVMLCAFIGMGAVASEGADPPRLKTKNVVIITTDGLRWQEVFTGADPALMNKEDGGVKDTNGVRKAFWRETPEARREALMPFFWKVIAKKGQIYGNQTKGSVARVTNGMNFSYPGYNEIFTGFADPRIDSNAKRPNPNVTVLEWLNAKPAFKNRTASFAGWDVTTYMLNRERSGLLVWVGTEPLATINPTPQQKLLDDLVRDTPPVEAGVIIDSLLYYSAEEYTVAKKPRVLYIGYGETDEWGHAGRYDRVLEAAHTVDRLTERLWNRMQSMPEYRDQTTFIITTDHGRGLAPVDWKGHGKKLPLSESIWMAFLGPDTPALGERTQTATVTQSQIAATMAALLGEDYHKAVPQSGALIGDVVGGK